jgi:3-dehydroquinate synthase
LSDLDSYEKLRNYLAAEDLKNKDRLSEIIMSTLEIKKSYFSEDEFDTGRRNLLNYGHCFGHALESASNYAVCHGEAVVVGMSFANLLSLRRGVLFRKRYEEFQELYQPYFPDFDIRAISVDQIIKYLKKDKKRVGKDLTMVIAEDIGSFHKCDDIKEEEVRNIYKEFISNYLQRVS